MEREILPLGKLDFRLLEKLLNKYQGKADPRVVVGPKLGEDAAIIDYPDRYLVVKTDPVTFATEEIGWYAVQVNANDIATRGATPKWFQAAILLPENRTTEELVERIFAQISRACGELNITVIGGHTEISYDLDRPIIVGCMLGEVKKEKLVSTSGAKPGDTVILTKGIAIEGTSIIARERAVELRVKGYPESFIRGCQNLLYSPGLSIVKDALVANQLEVHSMHDPTEGGLAAGLYEVALASQVGLLIRKDSVPILGKSAVLCREYNLDPLRTIASGALLIVVPPKNSGRIVSLLRKNGINASPIGEVKEQSFGIKITTGQKIEDLEFSARDEITRIFE